MIGKPNFAVVPAGGSGQRFGATVPKVLVELAGCSILERTLKTLLASGCFERIVVPCHPLVLERIPAHLKRSPLLFVLGAETRQKSVALGLQELHSLGAEKSARVLIHDAARCLLSLDLIERCLLRAWQGDQPVSAALPQTDSLKLVASDGTIMRSVSREGLWRVQTPQVFTFGSIFAAHCAAQALGHINAGDDLELVEASQQSLVVPGEPSNIKITIPEDLEFARAWLAASASLRD